MYTQEDVKDPVKVNVEINCHGIQHNESNENNVAVQKLELGQGRDPGVMSAPFVNSGVSVLDTQGGNVVQSNENANPEDGYNSKKILEGSEFSKDKEVSENIACLENASRMFCFFKPTRRQAAMLLMCTMLAQKVCVLANTYLVGIIRN